MARFESFEEIVAWQKAHVITLDIYKLTEIPNFAKDYGLKDQIRRAAISIMANIAEGHVRKSNVEFANFLNIARGSVAEVHSTFTLHSGKATSSRQTSIDFTLCLPRYPK